MGNTDEEQKKRVTRKLIKRRKPQRASSVLYPERLQVGDDVHQDVTALKPKAPNMNQSVFSMIAAAGSRADFHARFDEDSSGSEEEQEISGISGMQTDGDEPTKRPLGEEQNHISGGRTGSQRDPVRKHDTTLPRSLPKLNLRTIKERNYMSQSCILPPAGVVSPIGSINVATPRDAPVMSRMLEAQAQLRPSTPTTVGLGLSAGQPDAVEESKKTNPVSLVARLKEIFGFEKPEEVISGLSLIAAFHFCLLIVYQSILAGFYKVYYCKGICILQIITSASMPICPRNL